MLHGRSRRTSGQTVAVACDDSRVGAVQVVAGDDVVAIADATPTDSGVTSTVVSHGRDLATAKHPLHGGHLELATESVTEA
jgi:hypothetical protein